MDEFWIIEGENNISNFNFVDLDISFNISFLSLLFQIISEESF